MSHDYSIITLAEQPDLIGEFSALAKIVWPEFVRHAKAEHWPELYDRFAPYLFVFVEGNQVIAAGHTIPFRWNQTRADLPAGIRGVMERAIQNPEHETPDSLCALAAIVTPEYRGRGLSTEILNAMKKIALQHELRSFVAPVRPTLKADHPEVAMSEYITWRTEKGESFDPWIRTHERMGAKILEVASNSLTVTGSLQEWRDWTGLEFPRSGDYPVKGALTTVEINCEKNLGTYEEPNVWMRHPLSE
jgi:GNAT superfamily N-acetyltransferase